MSILHHASRPVHSNPFALVVPADFFGPDPDADLCLLDAIDPADLEWWAAARDGDAEIPDPISDLAWLSDEASILSDGKADPLGARALAGSVLCDLVASLRFHRRTSAADYLADPETPVSRADLDGCRLPDRPREAALARELDALASWYLHLDSPAGDLAAWFLLGTAATCEEWGCRDLGDYQADEAAYRMAAAEAMCEERWN